MKKKLITNKAQQDKKEIEKEKPKEKINKQIFQPNLELQSWQHPEIPQQFNEYQKKFITDTTQLQSIHYRFNQKRNNWNYLPLQKEFHNWIDYYYEACELDLLEGTLRQKQLPQGKDLTLAPGLDVLYKSFNYFRENNFIWPARFEKKFIQKVGEMNEQQTTFIFCFICYILSGRIYGGQLFRVDAINEQVCPPYFSFFKAKIFNKKHLLFMVGIEKVPSLDKMYQKIIKFDYIHYLRFLDILSDKDLQKLTTHTSHFLKQIMQDPARSDFTENNELTLQKNYYQQNQLFVENKTINNQIEITLKKEIYGKSEYPIQQILQPNQFQTVYVTKNETESLIYDQKIQRWIDKDEQSRIEKKQFTEYAAKVNKEILEKYADFSSAAKLVELLQKIPNFCIKLTDEEIDVVGQSGNVMVIGRSGTGKTTCAVLRLFSMEMLFKLRLQLYKNKHSVLIKDTKFSADDVDNNIGLHSIFVTASPILTNEIRRYYKKLTDQIKEELKKKQEKIKQQQKQLEKEQKLKISQDDSSYQILNNTQQSFEELKQESQDQNQNSELNKQMEEELQDIQLTKKISHESEQENEKDQQEDLEAIEQQNDEDVIENQMDKFNNLNDLQEADFPAFFTVKRLILMIDGCMNKPFFTRNKENQIIGQDIKATWHNESQGVMLIDNYYKKFSSNKNEQQENNQNDQYLLEEEEGDEEEEQGLDYEDEQELEQEYQRQVYLQQKKQKQIDEAQRKKASKQLAFEVDYNYFSTYFWPKIQSKANNNKLITASLVWTEIQSYLKGSASAHTYGGWYLPKHVYLRSQTASQGIMDVTTKDLIYEMFIQYEIWKLKEGAYDIMDVVNYLLANIRFGRYQGQPIHYMMIDEVQDLPHAILLLIMKVTEQGLFFSGDTAQTIAQGVGFRFCDLKSLFSVEFMEEIFMTMPTVKQLTINFRSHNRILELANSVVTLVEIFFPKTIDRLNKERSNIDGPKPILLADADPELLFLILCGEEQFKSMIQNNDQSVVTQRQPLEFGCNQVILVRDQEAKQRLPKVLQHALCLTIYEAKGLEFEDVILWNFFKDSPINKNKWNLLQYLLYEQQILTKKEYLQTITIHEKKNNQKDQEKEKEKEKAQEKDIDEIDFEGLFGQEQNKDQVILKKVKLNNYKYKQINILEYNQLCTELKQLYVAITRPRNRLIIYDENNSDRQIIEAYWHELGTVEIIDKSVLQNIMSNNNQIQQNEQCQSKEISIFKSILHQTSQEEWKKQGIKMFKHKFFQQAAKCFEKAGEQQYFLKANAYMRADNASKSIVEVETERGNLKDRIQKFKDMDKHQLKQYKNKLNKQEQDNYEEFRQVAGIFKQLGNLKQAAQCYFSGQFYREASEHYIQLQLWSQAGQALYLLEEYEQAAFYFDKSGDYIRVIECLDLQNQWERILETINKYSSLMTEKDKAVLIRKYAPLAFQELVSGVEMQQKIEQDEEQKQQPAGERIKKEVDTIAEGDSEEEDDEDEEEENDDEKKPQLTAEQTEQIERLLNSQQQEGLDQKESIEQIKQDEQNSQQQVLNKENISTLIDNMSFEVIQQGSNASQQVQSNNPQQVAQDISQMSFSEINQSQSHQPNEEPAQTDNNLSQQIAQMSFEMLEKQAQLSQQQKMESFEHLSHLDIEGDEWLKQDNGSLIESISEARKNGTNISSDYSAVEYNQMLAPSSNLQLVKTRADIFIQDSTMAKIIKYISMLNQEFKNEISQHRSKAVLLTQEEGSDQQKQNANKKLQIGISNDPITGQAIDSSMFDLVLDLDQIDVDCIHLILDTLEHFKIYKLCIFVCNRYKIVQRLGRYVASLAHKYSSISLENSSLNHLTICPGHIRQAQLEKAYVASIAMHNILENINPEFLCYKISDNRDQQNQMSLGLECYQSLILLGFWKKVLFLLNKENSLDIASVFSDFKSYKYIYLTNCKELIKQEKEQNNQELNDLLKLVVKEGNPNQIFSNNCFASNRMPQTDAEREFSIISLEHIIWYQLEQLKKCHNTFLSKYYIQQQDSQQQQALKQKEQCDVETTLPIYMKYNQILWQFISSLSQQHNEKNNCQEILQAIKESIYKLKNILDNKCSNFKDLLNPEIQLYDIVSFLTILINLLSYDEIRLKKLIIHNFEIDMITSLCDTYLQLMKSLNDMPYCTNSNYKYYQIIQRAVCLVYRVRCIPVDSQILQILGSSHSVAHISSPIVQELMNYKHNKQQEAAQVNKDISKLVLDEVFNFDNDHEYILCPISLVLNIIKEKIYDKLIYLSMQKINLSLNQFEEEHLNLNNDLIVRATQISRLIGLKYIKEIIDENQTICKKQIKMNDDQIKKKTSSLDNNQEEIKVNTNKPNHSKQQKIHSKQRDQYQQQYSYQYQDSDEEIIENLKDYDYLYPWMKKQNLDTYKKNNKQITLQQKLMDQLNNLLIINLGKCREQIHNFSKTALLQQVNKYIEQAQAQRFVEENYDETGLDNMDNIDIFAKFMHKALNICIWLGKEDYYYEICKMMAKKQFSGAKQFQNLLNSKQFLEFGLVEDYSDQFFLFYHKMHNFISINNSIQILEECVITNLVSICAINENNTIILPKYLLINLPNLNKVKGADQFYELYTNISQIDHLDIINECLEWLEKLANLYKNQELRVQQRILNLLFLIIINLDEYPIDIINCIYQIIYEFQSNEQFQKNLQKQAIWKNICDFKTDNDLFKIKKYIIENNFLIDFQDLGQDIKYTNVVIKNSSNVEETSQQYQLSDIMYQNQLNYLGKRLIAKRKILRFMKKYFIIKEKNQIRLLRQSPLLQIMHRLPTVKTISQLSVIPRFAGFSIINYINANEKLRFNLINTYFQTYIENAIDFHYIFLQLNTMNQQAIVAINHLNQYLSGKIQKEVYDIQMQMIQNELVSRNESFNIWKQCNVRYEANTNAILKKQRKIKALKWQQSNQGGIVQKLAQKRAGLKKLKALQLRRQRIKMQII